MVKNGLRILDVLQKLKFDGLVANIGTSVYSITEINFILDNFDIDLIQVPMNVFDQRLLHAGILAKLKKRGIEIHARSAFLQGVVFMDAKDLPNRLRPFKHHIMKFHNLIKDSDLTPIEACLSFLMQQKEIDKIICGINSLYHFKQILNVVRYLKPVDKKVFDSLVVDDINFLNPSKW